VAFTVRAGRITSFSLRYVTISAGGNGTGEFRASVQAPVTVDGATIHWSDKRETTCTKSMNGIPLGTSPLSISVELSGAFTSESAASGQFLIQWIDQNPSSPGLSCTGGVRGTWSAIRS
jgi:hypothetical protein